MKSDSQSSSYMPQLDGLRAIAVGGVVYSHWVPSKYHFGLPLGSAGVQLFFVLSGFLITRILLGCRRYNNPIESLRAFYARRVLRIFPLFYATIFAAALINIHPVRETLLWHLTYASNIYFLSIQSWNGPISHFWSLAVEEQFYLLWPAVVLFLPPAYLRLSVIGLITIGIASRFLLPIILPSCDFLYVLPNANFDALGLGALLAFVLAKRFRSIPIGRFVWSIPLFGLSLLIRKLQVPAPFLDELQNLFMLGGFVWLIENATWGFQGWGKKLLEMPLLLYLGRISYGVYILHNFASTPVSFVTHKLGLEWLNNGITGFALLSIFTVAGASISWHFLEKPLVKLKRFFPYHRSEDPTINTQGNSVDSMLLQS